MFGLLTVIAGPDKGHMFTLTEGEILFIGSGPNLVNRLRDPLVARVHCQAQLEDGKALLFNYENSPGTRVNGREITEHTLEPGDVVQIGNTKMAFKWADSDERTTRQYPSLGSE
jgi:pSer/pThr/pTyr-binding forkhead associated (FHA) protein